MDGGVEFQDEEQVFGRARQSVVERRAEERRKVQLGCWLAAPDGGGLVQCTTRDFSASGARVTVDDQRVLPGSIWLLDLRHRLAYEARVAWRKAPEMGLQFLKVWRFDEVPEGLRGAVAAVSG